MSDPLAQAGAVAEAEEAVQAAQAAQAAETADKRNQHLMQRWFIASRAAILQ